MLDEPFYYLTLFKIKGHKTWRTSLKGHADGFDNEMKTNKMPEIVERKEFKIDRLTGEINPQ